MIQNSPELTGFSARNEEHSRLPQAPQAPGWMSPELLEQTRQLWSRIYDRLLSQQDAIEILNNIHRLAEVVWKDTLERRPQ